MLEVKKIFSIRRFTRFTMFLKSSVSLSSNAFEFLVDPREIISGAREF